MNGNKKFIAVIPARGGSKRFPGKNIHPLAGKPLIAHPIDAAKRAKGIDRVIVSTDDENIAGIAKEHGAEIPFMRPKELAEDWSSVIDVMVWTVEELERREKYHADYAILLQPTTPLVTPEQIEQAIAHAIEKNADSVVTVAEVDTINHPYNIREIKDDGTITFWQYDLHYAYYAKKPKPKFYHAANLWLTSYETLTRDRLLEGKNNYPIIVPPAYSMDIDYKEDLALVEAYLRLKAAEEGAKLSLHL
ncbi:MAG: acylneuraminate cytidylyltransferase family protein [Patescibacteria group bacterium]